MSTATKTRHAVKYGLDTYRARFPDHVIREFS